MRGRWFNIVFLNMQATSEEKCDEAKVGFYKELEHVFDHFSKNHMKILLGDFNAKVGSGKISNQQLGMRVYISILMIMV